MLKFYHNFFTGLAVSLVASASFATDLKTSLAACDKDYLFAWHVQDYGAADIALKQRCALLLQRDKFESIEYAKTLELRSIMLALLNRHSESGELARHAARIYDAVNFTTPSYIAPINTGGSMLRPMDMSHDFSPGSSCCQPIQTNYPSGSPVQMGNPTSSRYQNFGDGHSWYTH